MEPFIFQFRFDIYFDDVGEEPDVSINELMNAAVDWYESFAQEQTDAEIEDGQVLSVSLKDKGLIEVKIANVDPNYRYLNHLMEGIMNPDEDANHPIIIKDKMYFTQAYDPEIV